MLKTAIREQTMGRSQTFQWFSRFKAGRNSTDDDECSGRPVYSSTPEMIDRVRQHRGCIIPQTLTHSLVLLKMGKIISRNVLSWLELLISRYCCI